MFSIKPTGDFYEIKYHGSRDDFHRKLTEFLKNVMIQRLPISLSLLEERCRSSFDRVKHQSGLYDSFGRIPAHSSYQNYNMFIDFNFMIAFEKVRPNSIGNLSEPVIPPPQLNKLLLLL